MSSTRFSPIALESLDSERLRIAKEIIGGRKSLDGPFSAMLRSPKVADSLQRLGAYLRFESPLPAKLKELAIIVVARFWSAEFEWAVHSRLAAEAGLAPKKIDTIASGRRPQLDQEEGEVFDFVAELLTTGHVGDRRFADIRDRFGEEGACDLIAIAGFYCAISFFLNVDQFLPDAASPLRKIPRHELFKG